MKRFLLIFILITATNVAAETWYNNYKVAFNRTGRHVGINVYAHQLDPIYRYPILSSYTIEPDSFGYLYYPGTDLRGISWQEQGINQTYSYTYPDLNTRSTIILQPSGKLDLQ